MAPANIGRKRAIAFDQAKREPERKRQRQEPSASGSQHSSTANSKESSAPESRDYSTPASISSTTSEHPAKASDLKPVKKRLIKLADKQAMQHSKSGEASDLKEREPSRKALLRESKPTLDYRQTKFKSILEKIDADSRRTVALSKAQKNPQTSAINFVTKLGSSGNGSANKHLTNDQVHNDDVLSKENAKQDTDVPRDQKVIAEGNSEGTKPGNLQSGKAISIRDTSLDVVVSNRNIPDVCQESATQIPSTTK